MTRDEIKDAIGAVEHALSDKPDLVYDDFAPAVRHVGHLRDLLVEERRSGDPVGALLDRVNAILSMMVGAEYPLDGVRRERIEKVRDELRGLLPTVQ